MRHPPYDLKVNKEADRAVMIETVRRMLALNGYYDENYTYTGFGGPFLEDMKRMNSVFPRMKLVSLEKDAQTYARQEYHRFTNDSKLSLIKANSTSYFRNVFQPSAADIIWLDYLDFGKQELADFVYLATILPPGSMLRISVRGEWKSNLPTLADSDSIWERVYKAFRDEFGDLVPEKLEPEFFNDGEKYCSMVCEIIMKAIDDELASPLERYFQPLAANFYKDETRMFSLMGVIAAVPDAKDQVDIGGKICDRNITDAFIKWDLASLDGKTVHLLNVPSLSLKERLALDKHLPLDAEERVKLCLKELPYLIGGSVNDSANLLKRYASFASYYSQFVRVIS